MAEIINTVANNALLDRLSGKLQVKNDAALSRALHVAPPVVSKIRHGRLDIGDTLIIRIHELTSLPVREIKQALGKKCLEPHRPLAQAA